VSLIIDDPEKRQTCFDGVYESLAENGFGEQSTHSAVAKILQFIKDEPEAFRKAKKAILSQIDNETKKSSFSYGFSIFFIGCGITLILYLVASAAGGGRIRVPVGLIAVGLAVMITAIVSAAKKS
jgi:hypothetical protein